MRFAIITVGMTHSGKSTFSNQLSSKVSDVIVVDPDNHAAFINDHYRDLLPLDGPNTLKNGITEFVINYAIMNSRGHIVVCSANRSVEYRDRLLRRFKETDFTTVVVFFNLSPDVLRERVENSNRQTNIFRNASGFHEVLERQLQESENGRAPSPTCTESDYFLVVDSKASVESVLENLSSLIENELNNPHC